MRERRRGEREILRSKVAYSLMDVSTYEICRKGQQAIHSGKS
jgi:hypothetical protein